MRSGEKPVNKGSQTRNLAGLILAASLIFAEGSAFSVPPATLWVFVASAAIFGAILLALYLRRTTQRRDIQNHDAGILAIHPSANGQDGTDGQIDPYLRRLDKL